MRTTAHVQWNLKQTEHVVDLYEIVAQLPLQSTIVQGLPKQQPWAKKMTFQLKRYIFSVHTNFKNSEHER